MSETAPVSGKALMLLTAARWKRRGDKRVPIESRFLFHQREAVQRRADALGVDIVEEFILPKQTEFTDHPLFGEMLKVIRNRRIDYVIIYPTRLHRIRERNAAITGIIHFAGAEVVSASDATKVSDVIEFMLYAIGDIELYARREDQKAAAQKRHAAA